MEERADRPDLEPLAGWEAPAGPADSDEPQPGQKLEPQPCLLPHLWQ